MNRQHNQIAALYCRVDGGKSPSGPTTILNQQKILSQYAKEHGLENVHIFSDYGVSGTTFSRPRFRRMLQEIKAGNVSALVVKSLDRVSRNPFDTVMFLEKILPQYGVAFYSLDNAYLPMLPLYQAICAEGGRA